MKKITSRKVCPESVERPWQLLLLLKLDSQVGIIGKHSKTRRRNYEVISISKWKKYIILNEYWNRVYFLSIRQIGSNPWKDQEIIVKEVSYQI